MAFFLIKKERQSKDIVLLLKMDFRKADSLICLEVALQEVLAAGLNFKRFARQMRV
jgi:hypothetical protein